MDVNIKQKMIQIALKKYHSINYCDKQIQEDLKPFFLIKRKLSIIDINKLDKGFILNNIILLSNTFGINGVIEIFDIILNNGIKPNTKLPQNNDDKIKLLNSFLSFLFKVKIQGEGIDSDILECLNQSVYYKRYLKRNSTETNNDEITNLIYSQEM